MKRLLSFIGAAALLAVAQNACAQGTVFLNNYDSGMGIFLGNLTTSAPVGTYFEVLGGPSAGSLTPITSTTTGAAGPIFQLAAGDVGTLAPGSAFDKGYGAVTGVASSGTAFLQVLAWTGAPTYGAAPQRVSIIWSQAIGTADNPGPPILPGAPKALNIPGAVVVPVPEPSTIALAGLGLAGLLALRRRK